MAQAGTNFPKVRRMLFFFLLKFWDAFSQPPRCFTGTSLLPFRLFLRPILKFWSIGVALMRITWANHQPGGVHKSTFPQICILFLTCRTSTLEDAIFTEWSGASSFEVILARQSSHFPTWASASGTWFSMRFSHSAA